MHSDVGDMACPAVKVGEGGGLNVILKDFDEVIILYFVKTQYYSMLSIFLMSKMCV